MCKAIDLNSIIKIELKINKISKNIFYKEKSFFSNGGWRINTIFSYEYISEEDVKKHCLIDGHTAYDKPCIIITMGNKTETEIFETVEEATKLYQEIVEKNKLFELKSLAE